MLSLLSALLIFCVVCWAVYYLTSLPGVPPPVRVIAYVVLAVFAIIWLAERLPGGLGVVR